MPSLLSFCFLAEHHLNEAYAVFEGDKDHKIRDFEKVRKEIDRLTDQVAGEVEIHPKSETERWLAGGGGEEVQTSFERGRKGSSFASASGFSPLWLSACPPRLYLPLYGAEAVVLVPLRVEDTLLYTRTCHVCISLCTNRCRAIPAQCRHAFSSSCLSSSYTCLCRCVVYEKVASFM